MYAVNMLLQRVISAVMVCDVHAFTYFRLDSVPGVTCWSSQSSDDCHPLYLRSAASGRPLAWLCYDSCEWLCVCCCTCVVFILLRIHDLINTHHLQHLISVYEYNQNVSEKLSLYPSFIYIYLLTSLHHTYC